MGRQRRAAECAVSLLGAIAFLAVTYLLLVQAVLVLSATRATLTETTVRFKGVFHDFRSFRLGFGLVHCPVSGCFSGE